MDSGQGVIDVSVERLSVFVGREVGAVSGGRPVMVLGPAVIAELLQVSADVEMEGWVEGKDPLIFNIGGVFKNNLVPSERLFG